MKTATSSLALLLALSAVVVVLLGEAPHRVRGERPEDFVQLYVLSWNLRHDGPVYAPVRTPPELAARLGWTHASDYSFANPPALVPFLYPVSLVPYPVAWWGLLLLSALALPAAVVIAAREMSFPWTPSLTAGVLLLATPPSLVLLVLGHVEALVVLLGVLGWRALRRGRLVTGGALWGLCAAFKLFPALWILGLLPGRNRRAALSAVVAALVSSAVGAWVVGPHELMVFFTQVLPQAARWRLAQGNLSLLSLGAWMGAPALGWALVAATAVLVVPSLVTKPRSVDGLWIAAVAASLLMSPLAWSYYFVFTAPCLAVAAGHVDRSRPRVRLLLYALGLGLLAWPSLLGAWSTGWLAWAPAALRLVLTFVPTAALGGMLVLGLRLGQGTPAPADRAGRPVAGHFRP